MPNLSFAASAPNAGAREPVGSSGGFAVKLAIAVGRGVGLDEIYKRNDKEYGGVCDCDFRDLDRKITFEVLTLQLQPS